jgi:Septum formation
VTYLHLPSLLYGILTDAPPTSKGSLMSQPPTPPGSPGQPLPQPQPQPWPQQGMQPPADRGVDPDGPGTPPPSDPGSIAGWSPPPWTAGPDAPAGWTPPPWSPDAADTRPFWRRIPAVWLEIAGALVLVGAVVGWYFIGVNTTTTGAPNATVTVTQSADASRSATGESGWLGGNPHDYKLRVVDLRVGDCFDDKDPYADEIEDVKAVPCTTEHDFEVFYVGAMGEGSYPTDDAFGTHVTRNCLPAFGAYIGKAYDDSDLAIYWLARPTMPGGRAIGPCSAPPTLC